MAWRSAKAGYGWLWGFFGAIGQRTPSRHEDQVAKRKLIPLVLFAAIAASSAAAERITVEQLEQKLAALVALSRAAPSPPNELAADTSLLIDIRDLADFGMDADEAAKVDALELTERLTAQTLTRLTAKFKLGMKTRLALHFVQGFTDDPALLFAALGNKKNNEVQSSVMLKSQDETNAQQNVIGMMSAAEPNGASAAPAEMIAALQNFIQENDTSQETDRVLLTMTNPQRLATFLGGFPGAQECDLVFRVAYDCGPCGSTDGSGVAEDAEHAGGRAGGPLSGGCGGSRNHGLLPGG